MELKIYCIASNQHANNKQFRSFVTFLHYDSDAKSPMGRNHSLEQNCPFGSGSPSPITTQ